MIRFMGISLNYIESVGKKVFYRISGVDNSPTIVFVHGIAGDSRFFHNQLKSLGNNFRIIAVDLPGHGRSHNPGEVSAEFYSRSIEQIIKVENIESYILAGHSMGGGICLEHYKNNHAKIKALILISTAPRIPVTAEMFNRSLLDFENFFNKMISSIFHKKAGIFIIAAKKNIDSAERKIITDDLKICMSMDYTELLHDIDIPVLILANSHDRMVPAADTIEMYGKIKNSKLVIFDKEGHIPFFEDSEEFNSAVTDFISSLQ